MKILHLLNTSVFSGAENVVCQIISMFKDEPDVEMVYCSREGQIRETLEKQNIRFVAVSELNVREIRRVIQEQRPDIIHAHDMRASLIAALSCKGICLISHIHNNSFDSQKFTIKSVAYILAAIKAKHILWVSKSAFNGYVFHKLFQKKSAVLYNIIDVDALYRKMRTDDNTYDYDITYIGRLTSAKNPKRLMRVFRLVKEKMPDVKIAVVGSGELEEETISLAKTYKLLDNVHFWGFQPNPLKILHDSKVMVMTSYWEGTPMCALEAMALGVPIVSTPTDGLKDLIYNEKNGYLSDDDELLAMKIIEIIQHENIRERMSCETKRMAKTNNNIQMYRNKLMDVYKFN